MNKTCNITNLTADQLKPNESIREMERMWKSLRTQLTEWISEYISKPNVCLKE